MGFPSMLTGVGLVPYDTLANYFHGTMGISNDLIECEGMAEKAVDLFADLQIANLQYFRPTQQKICGASASEELREFFQSDRV